jgi:hypothetical protein
MTLIFSGLGRYIILPDNIKVASGSRVLRLQWRGEQVHIRSLDEFERKTYCISEWKPFYVVGAKTPNLYWDCLRILGELDFRARAELMIEAGAGAGAGEAKELCDRIEGGEKALALLLYELLDNGVLRSLDGHDERLLSRS